MKKSALIASVGMLLVLLQFGILVLLLWPWAEGRYPEAALVILLPGIVLGLATLFYNRPGNFNIRPQLKAHTRFINTGPYAYVRHPMYASLLLVGLAAVVYFSSLEKLFIWIILFAILRAKSRIEEQAMRQRFFAYGEYADRTGCFFPRLGKPYRKRKAPE